LGARCSTAGQVAATAFQKAFEVDVLAWAGLREGSIPYCPAVGFPV
jgi:hypothetical protein